MIKEDYMSSTIVAPRKKKQSHRLLNPAHLEENGKLIGDAKIKEIDETLGQKEYADIRGVKIKRLYQRNGETPRTDLDVDLKALEKELEKLIKDQRVAKKGSKLAVEITKQIEEINKEIEREKKLLALSEKLKLKFSVVVGDEIPGQELPLGALGEGKDYKKINKLLGAGGFGKVKLGQNLRGEGDLIAFKIQKIMEVTSQEEKFAKKVELQIGDSIKRKKRGIQCLNPN